MSTNPNTSTAITPDETIVKKKLGVGFWLCVAWLGLMTFIALFTPLLPLKSPTQNFLDPANGRPP